jgi:hypothetical protein
MRASEQAAHVGECGLYEKETLDKILAYNRLFPVSDPAPLDLKDLRLVVSSSATPREGQGATASAVLGSKWRIGVEAIAPSVTVNRELQLTMRSLDFMWFGVSPWKLRVKPRVADLSSVDTHLSHNHSVAFQLTVHVYRIQTQRYVIDVSLYSGDFAAAFAAAQELINALATNTKLSYQQRSPTITLAPFTTS